MRRGTGEGDLNSGSANYKASANDSSATLPKLAMQVNTCLFLSQIIGICRHIPYLFD